jgi:hypothetical protein
VKGLKKDTGEREKKSRKDAKDVVSEDMGRASAGTEM